jgi:hypothetical protein
LEDAFLVAAAPTGMFSHQGGFSGVEGNTPEMGTLPGPHLLSGSPEGVDKSPRSPVVVWQKNLIVPMAT